MSAIGILSHWEITDDHYAFFDRTGMILNYKEIEWLGFLIDNFSGMFGPHQTTELTRFCLNNDEYHIVSVMPGAVFENRYIPHARGFYLAKGDNNPNLILNPFLRRSIDLVYEEILHKSLAVCSNINRGKQG